MVKKKRTKKTTVFLSIEGYREEAFLEYLIEKYTPKASDINITISPNRGGTPNSIINEALRNLHYNKVYAWFDEDKPIENNDNDRIYEKLKTAWNLDSEIDSNILSRDLQEKVNVQKRNPILIVSTPLSLEGILIRLFDKKMPQFKEYYLDESNIKDNKKTIKSAMGGIFGKEKELVYYQRNLSKEILEEKSKEIIELELLLSIFRN